MPKRCKCHDRVLAFSLRPAHVRSTSTQCVGRTDRCRDTDVSLSILSVATLGLGGLSEKPFSAFKCTYEALYEALNEIPHHSTTWLLTRLDVPEPCVDASCDLCEDASRIGVLK